MAMPKQVPKLFDFSQSPELIVLSNKGETACLRLPAAGNASVFEPAPGRLGKPPAKSSADPKGGLLAIALTLGLHGLGLLAKPLPAREDAVKPPQTISVQWLSPKPAAAKPAQAAAKPTPVKKPVKAEPKPRPKKTPPKPDKPIVSRADTRAPAPASTTQAAPTPAASAPLSASAPAKLEPAATLPHLNADYLNNPAPEYPSASRQLGEQGRVLVRAFVDDNGWVAQALLRKSSGYSRLDAAALDSVKRWRFVPARRGEQAVSAWVVVPVAFTLQG